MSQDKLSSIKYKKEDLPVLPEEINHVFQLTTPELSYKEKQCCNAATD